MKVVRSIFTICLFSLNSLHAQTYVSAEKHLAKADSLKEIEDDIKRLKLHKE